MSLPIQAKNRLLPFNRDKPGSWQRWENFWVDFLNAEPLLPWPSDPMLFKRVKVAEKYGLAGGTQDGIDIRAYMDDGTILAVQCKDYAKFDLGKGKTAMDKAENKFTDAQAYFLVLMEKEVSAELQKEADRRGNWQVIGRDTLSSWFLAGKFIPPSEQKRLVRCHFGEPWIRELFQLPGDDLLISAERFFQDKNLVRHDAQLQGKPSRALAESLATAMCGNGPRVAILTATGGQGKTRMLKAVAEMLTEYSSERIVRFQNDSANSTAEDYGLRAEDFQNASIFIDDAHRLENLRTRLLKQVSESPSAAILIAARPNNIEALKKKLLVSGFREEEWSEFHLPALDWEGRRALAVEILGVDDGKTPDFLAGESEQCPLVCTVGAELIRSGKIKSDLLASDDFKRRVFDHLMDSSLDSLFGNETTRRERAERVLRIVSMLSPIENGDEYLKQIARLVQCQPWDIDRLIPQLESAGLLRNTRNKIRVIPDLLADHLVYDTAYGQGKTPSLVREVISIPTGNAFANLFGNLAEAEWRARQEGKAETYLDGMWNSLRDMLRDPEEQRIFGLLNVWRKFAIFQPGRTLELTQIFLDHESARVAAGISEVRYEGFRYDSISMHLGKLPDLLAPVAMHHQNHRQKAFDLLWQIGCIMDGPIKSQDELPAAWQTIASTASLSHWEKEGPQDAFEWLKSWVRRKTVQAILEEGRSFLSKVASQWFESRFNRKWREVEAIRTYPTEIEKFRDEVLRWIETEIIPAGVGPSWTALHVIFAAGYLRSNTEVAREELIVPPAMKSLELLRKVLDLYDDPALRLSVWQYLSRRVAAENRGEQKSEWLALRNSIIHELPFQLVRLASSFAIHEYNHEQLQMWEQREDYDEGAQWWSDLASQTVRELRRLYPSIRESMEQLDQADCSLARFRQRASWDTLAETWSKQFPEERSGVLDELMAKPEHALVPSLGYFLGLSDETDCEFAEDYTLSALEHSDDRVRRATLHRLSWRDVKRRNRIADRLNAMSASDDHAVVAAIAGFISWNQYEATPYLDEALAALNVGIISISELVGVAEAITNLLKYAKHTISSNLLASFFRRLEQEEDLNQVFPYHVLSVFHEKFPVEMFQVHLTRIRSGKFLPWLLDDWFLSGLPERLDHPAFEKTARELFDETIRADENHFRPFTELFDLSVARVRPELAAELLTEELRKRPREKQALQRIVDLTGAGHGSVVYDAPEFTKELLREINHLPVFEAKELRDQLIFGAVPHSWSYSGEGIDEEYLWAKDRAGKLAENYRSDSELREFYLAIVKNQEDLLAHVRQRCRDED